MNLYGFDDYRDFLKVLITEQGEARGFQSRLAEAMRCSRSLLSQVMNKKLDLTADHLARLAHHLHFDHDQTEYLLLLPTRARADTPYLKRHAEESLRRLRKRHTHVSERLKDTEAITDPQFQSRYCTSWAYPAVHMAIALERCQTLEEISSILQIEARTVARIIQDLAHMGMITEGKRGWKPTKVNLHLPKASPMATALGVAWRNQSIHRLGLSQDEDLFYSGCHTMDASCYANLRESILQLLQNSRDKIAKAPSEKLVFLGIDLYSWE